MKNILSINMIIGIIMFAFISCTKENVTIPQSTDDVNSHSSLKYGTWGLHLTWYPTPGLCGAPAINCFDPIVVTAREAYEGFLDVVNGDASDVEDFFNNAELWPALFPDLDIDEGANSQNIDYLEKLQSGNYDLIFSEDTENHITYFFAGTESPLTRLNAEFVLQLKTSGL